MPDPVSEGPLPTCICGATCAVDDPARKYREWECGTSMWIDQIGGDRWKGGARTSECQRREWATSPCCSDPTDPRRMHGGCVVPDRERALQERSPTTALRVHLTERELERLDRVAKECGWWNERMSPEMLDSARAACLVGLAMEAESRIGVTDA